ncbi:MAG TPA: ankyrin repeat domain-containing protein [Streptosporangiaceae bacterium]
MTLAAAQLAVARQYGFASWPRLKAQVETLDLAQEVDAFLDASIRDGAGRAARLLAGTPEIAGYDFRTAVVLGDAVRVQEMLRRDPGLTRRPDPRSGWTPLHAVAASRWHRLDPARAGGLAAVARLLLEAGADPAGTGGPRGGWTPLRCAVAGAANPAIVRLLLERGAVPGDHDLYLACFGNDDHESLRLLLSHAPDVNQTTALAAPVSAGDIEGARLLLEAGADPNHLPPADLYGGSHADDPPWPAVYAAVRSGAPVELVHLLLDHRADPDAPGPDGRSPYRLAVSEGRTDLADLLRRRGARDDTTAADRFLAACLRGDRAEAQRQLAADPGSQGRPRPLARLAGAGPDALVHAAGSGNTAALELMLDLGLDAGARGGEDGGTALHAAAYSGSAAAVRLLLDRGADIEARDTTWDSPPLVWAIVGSGEAPATSARPDWIATVRTLLEAGASTQGITLSPDDPKPPSAEVEQLLRGYGVGAGRPSGRTLRRGRA